MNNMVIDISHHNSVSSYAAIFNSGISGVFHKATQGKANTDPLYTSRKKLVRKAGLMHGAYHFGTGDTDGNSQAMRFLDVAQPDSRTLLMLDFEPNTVGKTMSLKQAKDFVCQIHLEVGKWPLLYSGHLIKEVLGNGKDAVLANCPFWLAQYGPKAEFPPNWPSWTLWQHTESGTVRGVNGNCDCNYFNGTHEELRTLWGY